MPQVKDPPAVNDVQVLLPETSTGTELSWDEPLG